MGGVLYTIGCSTINTYLLALTIVYQQRKRRSSRHRRRQQQSTSSVHCKPSGLSV